MSSKLQKIKHRRRVAKGGGVRQHVFGSGLGGYHGGSSSRQAMSRFQPQSSAPDVDINLDLAALRGRSRDLVRNACVATAAVGTSVTHIVGSGLSLRPTIDYLALGMTEQQADDWEAHTKREWDLWSDSRFCDVTGQQNFYGLQALAFRSMLESGDVFALTPNVKRAAFPYKLSIQLIEADRVSNPMNGMDNNRLSGGVKLDRYGRAIAYHVCNRHPGGLRGAGLKWQEVAAFGDSSGRRNVIHLFERLRPGQNRGVPFLASVIEPLKQLGRYTDAELQAAVISGAFAVFMRMDPEAFLEMFDDEAQKSYISSAQKWDGGLESGKAVNLLPGEEPVPVNPGRPNSEFDPFVTSIMRQIGMALEIPYEVLVMHFQSSYSAARGALLQAWRVFRKRRKWFAADFCQPIYELWLHEAIANGRVAAPGYFSDALVRAAWHKAVWTGDGPGSIDEVKEAKAAELRMNVGLTTLEEEIMLHDGGSWESKHRQQVKERDARQDGGLLAGSAGLVDASLDDGEGGKPDVGISKRDVDET